MPKNTVPDGWEKYSRCGRRIPGTPFVAFKVPLNENLQSRYNQQFLSRSTREEVKEHRWTLDVLHQTFDLSLVIGNALLKPLQENLYTNIEFYLLKIHEKVRQTLFTLKSYTCRTPSILTRFFLLKILIFLFILDSYGQILHPGKNYEPC